VHCRHSVVGHGASFIQSYISHCGERKDTTPGNVGHAWSGKVVSTILRHPYFDLIFHFSRDEWAKHKDLDQYEAKSLYIDALLKVRCLFVVVLFAGLKMVDIA
jgi:hypothetical protein